MQYRLIRDRHCINDTIEEFYKCHDKESLLYIKLEDPDKPNVFWRLLGYKENPNTLVFYDDAMDSWCSLLSNKGKEDALIELLFGVRKALKDGYNVKPIIDEDEYILLKTDKKDNFVRKKDGKELSFSNFSLNPLQIRGDTRCSTVRRLP